MLLLWLVVKELKEQKPLIKLVKGLKLLTRQKKVKKLLRLLKRQNKLRHKVIKKEQNEGLKPMLANIQFFEEFYN